jgi:hypothetical protein
MIPGPAPVITSKPASASSRPTSCAAWYCGSSGAVRAEPKMVTPRCTPESASNPSMNSPMMRITRHGSVRVKSGGGARAGRRRQGEQLLVLGGHRWRVVADRRVDRPRPRRAAGAHRRRAVRPRLARRGAAGRPVPFLGARLHALERRVRRPVEGVGTRGLAGGGGQRRSVGRPPGHLIGGRGVVGWVVARRIDGGRFGSGRGRTAAPWRGASFGHV